MNINKTLTNRMQFQLFIAETVPTTASIMSVGRLGPYVQTAIVRNDVNPKQLEDNHEWFRERCDDAVLDVIKAKHIIQEKNQTVRLCNFISIFMHEALRIPTETPRFDRMVDLISHLFAVENEDFKDLAAVLLQAADVLKVQVPALPKSTVQSKSNHVKDDPEHLAHFFVRVMEPTTVLGMGAFLYYSIRSEGIPAGLFLKKQRLGRYIIFFEYFLLEMHGIPKTTPNYDDALLF